MVKRASLKPGDTILFKRGDVWRDNKFTLSASGADGAPITYGAYGQGKRPRLEGGAGVLMQGRKWVVFDRLHFRDQSALRFDGNTHLTIRNSEVSDMGRACLRVYHDSQHVLIKNNKIHHCGLGAKGMTKAESGVNGEGIYIGNAAGKGVDKTGYVTVLGNEVYHTSDEGMNIKENTHNVLVEGNVVHDLETSDPGGINLRPVIGNNHVVRNNVVYNISGHPRAGKRVGTGIVTGEGVTVYNNIVYRNEAYGIRVMKGAKVYHNTAYNNGMGSLDITDKNVDVRNNIASDLKGNMAASKGLFVDADGNDFRLRSGSKAIAASNIGIKTDILGTQRPSSLVTYGAYEGSADDAGTPPPLPPIGLHVVSFHN